MINHPYFNNSIEYQCQTVPIGTGKSKRKDESPGGTSKFSDAVANVCNYSSYNACCSIDIDKGDIPSDIRPEQPCWTYESKKCDMSKCITIDQIEEFWIKAQNFLQELDDEPRLKFMFSYFPKYSWRSLKNIAERFENPLEDYKDDYETLLEKVIKNQRQGLLYFLMKTKNFDINAVDNQGSDLLWYAIQSNNLAACRHILSFSRFKKSCWAKQNGHRFLHSFLESSNSRLAEDIIKFLIQDEKLDVNTLNTSGQTALHHAARSKNKNNLELLLDQCGIDVNIADNQNNTALMLALDKETVSSYKKFISCDDNIGECLAVAKLLLSRDDLEVNHVNHDGVSALHLSTLLHDEEITLSLITKGCEINQRDKEGNTVLHLAAKHLNHKAVEQLLRTQDIGNIQIDVNATDNKGLTPLHIAVKSGSDSVVRQLLGYHNINIDAKDDEGRTPGDYLIKYYDLNIEKLFEDKKRIKIFSRRWFLELFKPRKTR